MAGNHGGSAYVKAWVGLLLLTGLSFGLGAVELGAFSLVVALTIAGVKALIVLWVFMHLSQSIFVARMVAMVNFIFVALLCLGVVADVAFR